MYKKLLLSSQGGIIDEIHRSEQDNCAVVAIGLGGTGVSCLKNLKAKVFNRVIPDDPDSAVPKYDHIKFLAVDSDKTGLVNSNAASSAIDMINLDTEYLDISFIGDINEVFKQTGAQLNGKAEYRDWLNHDKIKVTAAKTGACGVRQIGRYLFMQKANEFVNRVRNLISDAKRGLNNPNVYVHIFSGLGGGTGAGTFLDACYLVQRALSAEGTNAFTCGYFFLPDVNLSNAPDDETAANIQINSFASLQELDYCMNFESNGDKWMQRYPSVGIIETDKPPVDICHLISGRNTTGDVIPDAYNYAMNVVTDYFMDFLVKSEGFTMESHIANYVAKKAQLDKDSGAQYEYCVLGASNASLPFKEVLTYLASKMFEGFSRVKKNEPLKANVEEFVRSNGLTFDTLFNMLTSNVDMSFPRPDVKARDAQANDKLTTDYFADLRARAINTVERNYSTMIKDIESYDIAFEAVNNASNNVHASSIITKIFKAIYSCITDPERGPYYAAKLVNGTSGQNLIAVVDGHIQEIESKIGQLECNLDKYERDRTQKQNNFFSGGASKSKYKLYIESTRNLIIEYTMQETFYKMKSFLTILRKQLVDLSNKYCSVYNTVIDELIATFEANRVYLEDISDNVQEFEYPIATINDLKETLDERIKEIDIPSKMMDFQKYMLSGNVCKSWMTKNENEITKCVSKYFIEVFKEYTNKTMTSYLQDKYNTDNTDELIQFIRNDIMNQLDIKAKPLFWTSAQYNADNASKIGYISVPETSAEVVSAAQSLNMARKELTVRATSLQDRISIMRCFVGAPLYGYQPLNQLEILSMGDSHAGKHLYEGRKYIDENKQEVVGRDWRFLPSPTPASKLNSTNSTDLRNIAQNAEALYDKATKIGIIYEVNPNEFEVRIIDDSFMEEAESIAQAAIDKNDAMLMYEAAEKINGMKGNIRYSAKNYSIDNDAKNGEDEVPESEKRRVRVDHFAMAPVICNEAKNEIAKLQKLDELVSSLQPKVDTDFEDYANALFTGAITINGVKITYVNEYAEEIPLSAPIMKMGAIRLYQAYLNFKEIDEETRKNIKAVVDERNSMVNGMDEIVDACTKLKVQLDPKMRNMQLQFAKQNFAPQARDILDFFKKLENEFDVYKMNYGIII